MISRQTLPTPFSHRQAKNWLRVNLAVDSRMLEAVTAFLEELTGSGIEISSYGTAFSRPVSQNNSLEKITAYIDCTDENIADGKVKQLHAFVTDLPSFFSDCQAPQMEIDEIQEEDWGKLWKEFFTSYKITPRLLIRPSWETPDTVLANGISAAATIEMDPGLAFGTGHHASTQLALGLIDQLYQLKRAHLHKVLDVGTGSGILAMACGLFGARQILAIDNDPDAVAAAQKNNEKK
jgi:ribosomal protein L11 methyltransferase